MVFEGIVSDVLSRVLGEYVKNLNKDQLKIGVLGGNVVLTNLELKEDALANLPINLPITVKKGFLGRLELRVPWKDLKSKPVIVNIDNIYALAVPQTQSFKYDEQAEKKRELESKKKRIENYEWMKSIQESDGGSGATGDDKKDDSFTTRLVTKIIDNLQIVVNKVHIRFENRNEIGKLYAVGITLDRISAQSTDEKWIPSFIDSSKTNHIRKLAEMNALGVYIDDSATSLQNLSAQEFSEAFTKLIPTKLTDISTVKKFIIKPISSQLKVSINKSDLIDKNIPKILADCIFSDIVCALSSAQYHTIFNILNFTNEYLRDIKYLKFRPHVKVSDSPKLWWKYAGQVILEQVRHKRYTRSWDYLLGRRTDRKAYISLFKRSLPNVKWLTPLSKQEIGQLQALEDRLSFEDIVFYRSLAYAEIKQEAIKDRERKEFLAGKKNERGFFQNLFSSKQVKMDDEKAAPIVNLTTNEREELYRTIEYSDVVQSVQEPPDWVKVAANLEVRSVSLQLVEPSSLGLEHSFIDAVYSSLSVKFEQRPEGVKVIAGIKQFEVYDQSTKGTLYPKIVSSSYTSGNATFCSAIVDTAPPEKGIDLFVELNMNPLQVVLTKPLLLRVASFFSTQNTSEQLDLTNISNRAGDMLVNWTERTKSQLQEAIDSHKTLALSVNIQAPVIIVPENVLSKTSCALVLDLGNFKIRSDMNQSIKGMVVGNSLSENDFYDKFNLSLESIQLLLTNDISSWNDKHAQQENKTHLINQFDVHLKLYSCIQQDNLSLTNIKIFGDLPKLSLHLSERKCKQLLALVHSLTADIPTSPTIQSVQQQHGPETTHFKSTNVPKPLLDLYTNSKDNNQNQSMELLINHKKLNIDFKVQSIAVTISRDNADLIRLSVDGLGVQFSQRTFDMIGSVELNSLDIDDLFTHSNLKKLATSNPIRDLQGKTESSSLVSINFKQFQPNSPEYKKVDMTLDVKFESFYLVCNPPTIHQLLVLVNSFADQPAVTIKKHTVQTVENRKRVVRTLRAGSASPSPINTSPPLEGQTVIGPNGHKTIIKKVIIKKKKRVPSDNVSILVTATINSLGLVLNQENNKKVGIFSINQIKNQVVMYKDSRMSVNGSLGSIVLEDLTDKRGDYYHQVITPHSKDSNMLTFSFNTHPHILSNYPGYDSSVNANIKSIVVNAQIAFLLQVQNYFLGGMLDPILNRPIAVIPQADPTKLATVQLPPVSRTKIDVVMETPMFNVPCSIDSHDKLRLELGKIIVSNSFGEFEHNGARLPTDLMKIRMENTCIVIEKEATTSHFLKQLDIDINLTRFLVPNHNIDLEDLLIDITISHLSFYLDQQQYRFFLELADNATKEMAELTANNAITKPPPPSADIPYFSEQEVIQDMGKILMVLKVHLPLFSFNITGANDNFAAFDMRGLHFDLISTERKKSKIQIILEAIVLTDARKNSDNIFKNLLESQPDKKNPLQPFLNVGYIRDNVLGDQYININVNNVCLFLSPTPLLIITDFFLKPLQTQSVPTSAVPPPTTLNKSSGSPKFLAQTRAYDPFKIRTPSITLVCSASSEVTLVENETQPNTRCILGKALLHVYFKRDPRGIERATVSVRKVKVNIYRPTIQSDEFKQSQGSRPIQILKPIDHIKISYIKENETTDYWKQLVTLDCSTIKLFFSYDDVNTIVKIVNNLNFKQHLAASNQHLSPTNNTNRELSLGSSTGSTSSSFSSTTTGTTSQLNKSVDPEDLDPPTNSMMDDDQLFIINEKMSLKCPSISVLLINESMDLNLPVAELYLAEIEASATNWSTDIELKSSMTFKADYFNEANMKFEPFVEDWTYNFDVKKANGIMKAKFMATKEILNINVSHALLQTLNSTLLLVKQKDRESSSPLSSRFNQANPILSKYLAEKEPTSTSTTNTNNASSITTSTSSLTNSLTKSKFHSHWISNQTGVSIEYRIQHKNLIIQKDSEDPMNVVKEINVEEHEHVVKIDNQEMSAVNMKKEKGSRDSGMGAHETVDLLIMGGTIPKVSLDALGHRIYNFTTSQNISIDVDVEVKLKSDGSKIIYIRSLIQFANNTTCPIEIKTYEDRKDIQRLEPGASFSLPLEHVKDYKKLWFRVADTPQWSDVVVPDEIVAQGIKEREKQESKRDAAGRVNNTPFSRVFKAVGMDKSFTYFALSVQNTEYRTTTYTSARTQSIGFNAPVRIENLLPTSFQITVNGHKSVLECGRKLDVLNYAPGSGHLEAYISGIPGLSETKINLMSGDASSPTIAKSIKFSGSKEQRDMVLNIERTEEIKGIRVLSIYCQYWLVNNTLLPLVIRGSDNDETQMVSNDQNHHIPPVLYAQNNLRLKVNEKDTKFTSSTPICTVGNVSTLQLQGADKLYEISCAVDFCSNTRFGLSKVVNFAPRYVIQNRLNSTVSIGQYIHSNSNGKGSTPEIREILHLKPNDYAPFHWAVNTENKAISIKVDGQDYWWSGAFEIDTSGDFVVRIRPSAPEKPSILAHVTIKEDRGTLYIIIPRCNPDHPPYLIKNDTPYKISFTQKSARAEKLFDHLESDQSEAFGWDEPNGDYRLHVYLEGKEMSKTINLKKITGYKFEGSTPLTVYCTITIEKSSRYILFSTHSKMFKNITNWKTNKKNQHSSSSQPSESKSPEVQFFVRLSGMGISIIDSTPMELAYVSVKDVFLQVQQSEYENSLELKLGDVQIDNQSVKTQFPVLMHSVIKPNSNKDFVHISLVKSTFENIDHFRYFSTLIQELTIEIEDHWLRLMLEFAQSLPDIGATMSGITPHSDENMTPTELSDSLIPDFNITPPPMDGSILKMVYFALLVLNPFKANITLVLQPDGLFRTNHKVLSAIEGLGFTLTKLDRAPITLQGLIMEHPFSSWATMIDKLKKTYTSQALFQFYNILGSIDIIGNPVGLFRNFGTGVKDFFVEPANGIIKSPADFGKGLAKGTSSLVKNSVYGTFNTISKITGTIGSGVANLSFDDDYLHDRKVHQSRKPKHIGEGLAMGGIGLGRGLFEGITGIVTKPVEGAKKGGFAGFAKGLAQGVVGVAIKPTAAVIDATTKATEGIRNTTNLQEDKERVRPPRSFGVDNVLRPFEERESEGWYLLKIVHKGKHSQDNYIWHYAVNSNFTCLLSDQRLIYSRNKKNLLHSSFMWQIPHSCIKNVKFVPGNGLMLSLDPPQDLGLLDKSVKTITVPFDDDNICMAFNMKLDHTLRLYNEKLGHHYKKI
ncbi:vacuolar protein sorting-associated protein 13 family protein [Cavenderia fasciculata]|uniref:Vacuolar protein sorting-associated protein 13 family protein n=1 Tax=Cavenderia fasciculata TaxID=261658 RepID=F4PU37_CACFS|nr:vacuolar protein sorting-associated protein 13 family protein [Cavenderia fasciculata]EGG20963.1 vacuolar protein sorting-associated protein 13 family protein [Cavenderia fasciculata]|eukprot:XP_004358813.1 vacuolar protein sorting-associated protein 13 family protein [Cavenderia fasciculata]